MESPVNPRAPHHQQHSPNQTLPSISSLTNGLPPTSQPSPLGQHTQTLPSRDSGTWPNPHSKHSSLNNANISTLLNPDDSQSRNSTPNTPTSIRPPHTLPSINQGFENASQNRTSVDGQYQDSRRSSVDSRFHHGFTNLAINNPASPYESRNGSQVSLAASLRRPNGQSPLSPLGSRQSLRAASHSGPRIAPPIIASARVPGAPDPTAAKPTQGYPWAFPDSTIPEESREERRTSSSDSSASHNMSRQSSFAAPSSVRSSVFSESIMPPGQKRFEDGMGFQKIIGDAKSDQSTHHHSMQHRAVSALQNEEVSGAGGNYSRTPELRVSHKLAERKRRSEMKDLFEELNKCVPANGGAKASKWEILSKAIEHIKNVQASEHNMRNRLSQISTEAEYAREYQKENDQLRTEISIMHERLCRMDPSMPHIYGQYTSQMTQQHSHANGQAPRTGLPPMSHPPQHHYAPMPPPPGAMQGVEYGAPPPRSSYEMR
ncbi:hypothetical protein MBLNU457_g0688t1 [Dothideomycetes sp. NU457]